MKNVLKKLEKANFIHHVHKQAIVVDTIHFIEELRKNKDKFQVIKLFEPDDAYLDFMDLRVKSNLILSGFYDYLYTLLPKDTDDVMLSCNIDNEFTFIAFKDIQKYNVIVEDIFATKKRLPIHLCSIDLDYETKIHILMYDNNFKLPGFNLN